MHARDLAATKNLTRSACRRRSQDERR
jgi:hypothetical protein